MECKSMTSKDVLLHELSLLGSNKKNEWLSDNKRNISVNGRTMLFLKGDRSVILNLYI